MNKVNYGIDAPGIMRNLIVFGALTIVAGFAIPLFSDNTTLQYISDLVNLVGTVFFISGIAMFAYALKGKYRTRDLMRLNFELSLINYVFSNISCSRHCKVRSNPPAQLGLQMVEDCFAKLRKASNDDATI